jgi:DNA-binding transcriptional LysR family regulator
LAEFAGAHPEVEMALLTSDAPANLTNREADVAVRVVYDREKLPRNLHGRRGPELFGGVYASCDLIAAWRAGTVERVRWIVKDNIGVGDWAHLGDILAAEVPFHVTGADAQMVALHAGVGMTTLPCFVGDADPLLARVPGTDLRHHGTLWLLTQGETRNTKRVRLFTDFVAERLADFALLLAGQAGSD